MSDINILALQYQNRQKINNRNIKNILYHLGVFSAFCKEYNITRIEDISYEIIRDFQEDLAFRISRFGTLWKAKSQNNALTTIRGFLRWLVREDYLVSDPSAKIEYTKEPDMLPRNILDATEINKLLKAPDTNTLTGYMGKVIMEILYSTGIRKSELENLKLTDVDYKEGYLLIEQGKNKKDRVVPLGKIACDMIQNYILAIHSDIPKGKYKAKKSNYLFINQRANKLHHDTVWKIVVRYAKKAGIKKKVTPHSLRHTCATHMLKNGANIRHIQEMLGHTSITTTQKYTRITIDDLKKTHALCHPREKKD